MEHTRLEERRGTPGIPRGAVLFARRQRGAQARVAERHRCVRGGREVCVVYVGDKGCDDASSYPGNCTRVR